MGCRCSCVKRFHPDVQPFISELTEKDKDRDNAATGRTPTDSTDGGGRGGGGGGAGGTTTQPVISREEYNDKHQGSRNEGHGPPDPQPVPSPGDVFKTKEEKEVLKVVKVDLKIDENAKDHHTDRYELTQRRPAAGVDTSAALVTPAGAPGATEAGPQTIEPCLVVRRGMPFDISITFDRPFSSEKDDIRLLFDFGENPRETRGSRVVLLLSDEDRPGEWGAKILDQTDHTFTIRIFTPPQVQVNKWKFGFDAILRLQEEEEDSCSKVFRYTHDVPIYILFNPWCKDDLVFMSDDSWRTECVLNDIGRIFFGTQSQISSMPWNFGHFEDFVLDVAMLLLDNSGLNLSLRGNPIHVVRKISAMVNAPDDNGVVVGNWTGDYSGGTAPTAWNGSVAILEEFWKKREPVCYGQCWVFSAVVTTICRSLGIPCRSVTNFASAHDSDGSLTIDQYWDTTGKPMENYNQDSVWNFHVWNDVWMARPDIPDGFGGWQSVDATPQETSEGVYCVGPASVEAIRNGFVQLPYDGPFVFAEVNADRINNIQTKDGQWKHTFQENVIGKHVSTKSPDGDDRLDITDEYKFPEGSQQERIAVWLAATTGSTKKNLYKVEAEDMHFEMVHEDDALVGTAFDVRLKIRNNSGADQRVVRATLAATVVQYTGVPVCAIKAESEVVKVAPESEEVMKMTVKVEDYLEKLTDMCHIKISSMSQVEDTKQFHCDSDDFRLSKPDIEVKVTGEMKVGEEYDIEASFTNPLPKKLTNCEFTFEAPSLQRPIKVPHKKVSSKGSAKCTYKFTPMKEGETEVIVGFWSKELSNLTGTAKVKVVARS